MRVFIVTIKGEIIPCTINKKVIRPTIKGGYRILRLANKHKETHSVLYDTKELG